MGNNTPGGNCIIKQDKYTVDLRLWVFLLGFTSGQLKELCKSLLTTYNKRVQEEKYSKYSITPNQRTEKRGRARQPTTLLLSYLC